MYVDGEQFASADEFYDQALGIAANIPEITDEEAEATEWLPLGVFALAGGATGASNQTVQLAVSREGVITGTLYNETTRSVRPVEGTVDAKTQRAAWTFADGVDTHIVMETSIYNLTEESAEVLVHFSPEISQDWILHRLEEPDESDSQ